MSEYRTGEIDFQEAWITLRGNTLTGYIDLFNSKGLSAVEALALYESDVVELACLRNNVGPNTNEESQMEPRFPHVEVQLSNEDGNAFAVIGKTMKALRKADVEPDVISAFQDEAMSGNYDHVLATVMQTVTVN